MSGQPNLNLENIAVAEFADSQPPASKPRKRSLGFRIFLWVMIPVVLLAGIGNVIYHIYNEYETKDRKRRQEISALQMRLDQKSRYNQPAMSAMAPQPNPRDVRSRPQMVEQAMNDMKRAIVQVTIRDSKGKELGLGTGFIIDKQAHVATNFHVIRNAWAAEVKFRDETIYKVKGCKAFDQYCDLAILELDNRPTEFDVADFATEEPRMTEPVFALGHPKGLSFSTTTGAVSAVRTTRQMPAKYRQFLESPDDTVWIQTNTPITHGNSGGPLVNMQGEVIGVNTWIDPQERIGFASSISHLETLMSSMRRDSIPLKDLTGPMEEIVAIASDYNTRNRWYREQLAETKSKTDAERVMKESNPITDVMPKLLEVAKKHRNTPSAMNALRFLLSLSNDPTCVDSCDDTLKEALLLASQEFRTEHEQQMLIESLIGCRLPSATDFLTKTMDSGKTRAMQALACYYLGLNKYFQARGDLKMSEEAANYLKIASERFNGVAVRGHENIAESARTLAFRIMNLEVGRPAPVTMGTSYRGKDLKLSDSKGKVVVLFFWADWCPHSKKVYPVLRNLQTKYKGKPFEVFGVNCDPEGKLSYIFQRTNEITWANCCDGQNGPISDEWQITGFPCIIVIDDKGVIRHSQIDVNSLPDAVGELVAEATGEPYKKEETGFSWKKLLGMVKKKPTEQSDAKPDRPKIPESPEENPFEQNVLPD